MFIVFCYVNLFYYLVLTLKRYTIELLTVSKLHQKSKRRTLLVFSAFYVYGSVHHNIFYEITNRCSYMQSILFHCYVHSTCFGCFVHPSSGVQFNCIYSHWYKP